MSAPSRGGAWLESLVYEVSFDRSSNTLQGYLDIPPDSTGGVFTVGLAPEPSDLLLLAAECRPRKSPRLR